MIPFVRAAVGAACGAAAMYLLDPTSGRRRRAMLRDRLTSVGFDIGDAVGVAGKDLSHRTQGMGARLRSLFTSNKPTDDVLTERVRAALGRAVSHPRAIQVSVLDGQVRLAGSVLAHEHAVLIDVVSGVRGVDEVLDDLKVHQSADGIPELQGGETPQRRRFALLNENWPPGTRLMTGATAGGLVILGISQLLSRQRNPFGMGMLVISLLAITSGGALLTRSATNKPLAQLTGGERSPRRASPEPSVAVH
jgi:hypothetical protein